MRSRSRSRLRSHTSTVVQISARTTKTMTCIRVPDATVAGKGFLTALRLRVSSPLNCVHRVTSGISHPTMHVSADLHPSRRSPCVDMHPQTHPSTPQQRGNRPRTLLCDAGVRALVLFLDALVWCARWRSYMRDGILRLLPGGRNSKDGAH